MISVEEALEKILDHFENLESEEEELLDCLGRVLAEDVCSTIDIPPLDNSAMDGYAVQAASTYMATRTRPAILRVVGEVAAGYITNLEVHPSTAIRIMTGAPIPRGADAVVQFEDTDELKRRAAGRPLDEIEIMREAEPGDNVRKAGEDIATGDTVLEAGTVLRPQQLGVLASLGRQVVLVTRKPVVAVLATGDELVDIKEPLPVGKIYNSNTYSIAAQVARYGATPRVLDIARDNIQDLEKRMKEAKGSDLLITSAGVSVGEYDVVKEVLSRLGKVDFWTVRMKPGKPLAFGTLELGRRAVPHLGLPGNPVSSMITFEQFARPAIFKMLGRKDFAKPTIIATAGERVKNTDGRRILARVQVSEENGQYVARLVGPQGSGILTSMTRANGLMIVPEDAPSVEKGDQVQVQMLDWETGF
jgi:molybdopterin molybdotransferase